MRHHFSGGERAESFPCLHANISDRTVSRPTTHRGGADTLMMQRENMSVGMLGMESLHSQRNMNLSEAFTGSSSVNSQLVQQVTFICKSIVGNACTGQTSLELHILQHSDGRMMRISVEMRVAVLITDCLYRTLRGSVLKD